jgi:hypothetical protein
MASTSPCGATGRCSSRMTMPPLHQRLVRPAHHLQPSAHPQTDHLNRDPSPMILSRRDTLKFSSLLPAAAAAPSVAWSAPPKPPPRRAALAGGRATWIWARPLAWPGRAARCPATPALRCQHTPIPAQSWVTATWPDGSVKWTAHALPIPQGPTPDGLQVVPPSRPAAPVERVVSNSMPKAPASPAAAWSGISPAADRR